MAVIANGDRAINKPMPEVKPSVEAETKAKRKK